MAKKKVKKTAKPKRSVRKSAKSTSTPRKSAPSDWRAELLAEVRRLILAADTDMVEERKWKKASNPAGVPVWSHDGIVCTGETYKDVVKLTFSKGAALPDPTGLFNASLEGNTRRAIDLRQDESLDAKAFKTLIKAAVAANLPAATPKKRSTAKPKTQPMSTTEASPTVKLLSGGNPQIAKGDGDAPVQAYLAAMPGWKRDVGRRLDALITAAVPNVLKAVRWNSPFYGSAGLGWFLSMHCLTKYVRVTFFAGLSLDPIPSGGTEKSKEARWIDVYEGAFDADQMTRWIQQAAVLPGWDFGM